VGTWRKSSEDTRFDPNIGTPASCWTSVAADERRKMEPENILKFLGISQS
jgi:hypothetical protein